MTNESHPIDVHVTINIHLSDNFKAIKFSVLKKEFLRESSVSRWVQGQKNFLLAT